MGAVHAEIELLNAGDLEFARRNYISQDEVKRITVTALADSGSFTLAINENIQEYLQLPIIEKKTVQLANGERVTYDIVSPLELRYKNKKIPSSAVVLPGDSEVLLGLVPLETMELLIDPVRQELIVQRED